MEMANCPECNQLFIKDKHEICPQCYQKDAEAYKELTSLIKEKPSIPLNEAFDQLDISSDTFLRWRRNGRI
ncbi:hypothetical protein [Aquibacillus albus]|uniref:MerR family transcriptional regulator n=1 Tax=Aquibacillus albus TaxID=1168171 RepID=A0ABS2N3T8_9BACI|nr:hypothetical protein [Aquibacillus albus]MBM7572708.1 hypothetical protein [Aquibacillus albus]